MLNFILLFILQNLSGFWKQRSHQSYTILDHKCFWHRQYNVHLLILQNDWRQHKDHTVMDLKYII